MKKKVILGDSILMEQPDMVHSIANYHSTYVINKTISQIYTFSIGEEKSFVTTALPDASVDLIFYKNHNNGKQGVKLIGPVRKFSDTYAIFERSTDYFGMRFKPGIPLNFKCTTIKELFDCIIDIEYGKDEYDVLCKDISKVDSLEGKFQVFQNAINIFLDDKEDSKAEIVMYIIEFLLKNKEGSSLSNLSEKMGYTKYYINKVFHAYTGYSIGQYQKLLRLHRALNKYEYNRGKKMPESVNMAIQSGFSDQAHMIREFKNYTEMTPLKYWKKYFQK